MPETSQDAFESLYPGKLPITPHELRKRSNSVNKNPMTPKTPLDSLIGAESNFWPLDVEKVNGKRKHEIGVCDVDSCCTVSEPYGYKRQISHR